MRTGADVHSVPLSVADVHLRNEELPFGYFFKETLDEAELETALRVVLQDFPQMGGAISSSHTFIQCTPNDTVQLAFGRINMTVEEWLKHPRGHFHQSFTVKSPCKFGGHPKLLPIFDSIFSGKRRVWDQKEESPKDQTSLVKIRVTYFAKGGTAIGVSTSHALGDTATCVHFVQCWGKQMRQEPYLKWGSNRSEACVSGMMTEELGDLMGITNPKRTRQELSFLQRYLPSGLYDAFVPLTTPRGAVKLSPEIGMQHEYVRLVFPAALVLKLKQIGKASCRQSYVNKANSFVSTNDMLTSYGWLLKRHLSQKGDFGVSVVYNIRGRSGVDSMLIGNGISHVTAAIKDIPQSAAEHPYIQVDKKNARNAAFVDRLSLGAHSIRTALELALLGLPDALAASRIGRPQPPRDSSLAGSSFSTTNWGQFPLYKIRFGNNAPLLDFHGHPAHPLPPGRTYASVITPSPHTDIWYELLLPSAQAEDARIWHQRMTKVCMDWPREENTGMPAAQD